MEESQLWELGLCDDCVKRVSSVSTERWWVYLLRLPIVLVRKLAIFIGNVVGFFGVYLFIFCLMIAISHSMTRYHVIETVGSDKTIAYTHQDKETTDILNYLTGRSLRPRSLDGEMLPMSYYFDEKIYNKIWAIEKVSGNPRVRFIDQNDPSRDTKDTAYYYAYNNTMYITIPGYYNQHLSLEDFLAEASHALQFQENPAHFIIMSYRDTLLIFARTLADMANTFDKLYTARKHEIYTIPQTIENEAHSTIEPRLRQYVHTP